MKHKTKIKWILILIVIGYILSGLYTSYARAMAIQRSNSAEKHALEAHTRLVEHGSVPELIDYIAPQYGADKTLVKVITFCEANHRLGDIIHDGGKGIGTTGYHRETFEDDKKTFNRPDLVYESNFDQLTMMSMAFEAGEKYRRRWTTYVAYKNGGTYTFTDRNGVTHTARCSPSLAMKFAQ